MAYVLAVLLAAVALLIWAQARGRRLGEYIFKPLATLIVIGVAWEAHQRGGWSPVYARGILIGLGFSLGGDVALIFQEKRQAFLTGLFLFLFTHITYITTFSLVGTWHFADLVLTVVLGLAAFGFYRVLQGGLGAMRGPVILYMAVISFMVERAVATLWSPYVPADAAWRVALGALFFYISDVLLALDRFWRPLRYRRGGLFLYYLGQFLIAWAGL